MLKAKNPTYNDGVVTVYSATPERLGIGLNPASTEGLAEVGKFAFAQLSERQQDFDLAETLGFYLSRKIRIRNSRKVTSEMYAAVSGSLYEIPKIDSTKTDNFLFLEEIVCDGQVDLVSVDESINSIGVSVSSEILTKVYCRRISLEKDRAVTAGIDSISPTTVLRLRACDYSDQHTLIKNEKLYAVKSAKYRGQWVDLTARITPSERGDS